MQIRDHRVVGADYVPSPNYTEMPITPKFIIMHFTASMNDERAIRWLANPDAKVSAHIIIGRKGQITQMVPLNKRAWHAGKSNFQGYTDLNTHSIGIELVNIGPMARAGNRLLDGYERDTGYKLSDVQRVNDAYWLPYTDKQLETLDKVVTSLKNAYPSIFDCASHEEIDARGKKKDPGPLFPMDRYSRILDSLRGQQKYATTVNRLNVRTGPSSNHAVSMFGQLKSGDVADAVGSAGDWIKLMKDGEYIGYAHSDYLRRVA